MNPRASLNVARWTARHVLAATLFSAFAITASAQVYEVPVRETADSGPSLGPSGRPPPSSTNLYSAEPNRAVQPPVDAFFLPALLPVLGAAQPAPREPLATRYPREVVGEPFFMAYGNLAAQELLSHPRVERVASYRTARQSLLTELQVELDRGPEVAAEARTRALAGLATLQNPRLLELEAEAEQIRHELTRLDILKPIADDIGRLVPTDEIPEFKDALADLRMILSAAHFRAGFSSDQRRLLEEMAQEIRLTIEPQPLGSPTGVFFWPAGARIPIPAGLPPAAAGQFAEFERRKAALKAELHAVLDRDRRQIFNRDNTRTFARLAAAQAPRFAELDVLADQIRPALAALTIAGDTPAAKIPAGLASEHPDRQRDYAAAVFASGLSPAQRRLLLASAAAHSLQ